MGIFEGYVGIRLWDGQWVDDVIFGLLLVLFMGFALVFHTNYPLFLKMTRDVVYVKERHNLFEGAKGNRLIFRNFMIFQALFLCGICLFAIARSLGYFYDFPASSKLYAIGILVSILFLFYWGKRCLYYLFSLVFTNEAKYTLWKNNYNATIEAWGVSLYIPALWLTFVGGHAKIPMLLFAFFYILSRLVIIYKTIRIFHSKHSRLLYISLYLCGQEFLPLYFLYESIFYLYNFIESSTLWH